MKTIYCVYVVNHLKEDSNRVVEELFSDEETAQNYCDFWNNKHREEYRWVVTRELDKYKEFYKG